MKALRVSALLVASTTLAWGCGGGSGDGGGSNDGGECEGAPTTCALDTLSDEQQETACDVFLETIDDPAGTTYECDETGVFLEVESYQECIQVDYEPGCPLTYSDLIDCYQAAAEDACQAFSSSGACDIVFENIEDCLP